MPVDTRNAAVKIGVSKSPSGYHKLGSPELNPLPPLPKQNPSCTSGEMCFSKEDGNEVKNITTEEDEDDEEEEFFSPRGSSGRKESREISTPARIGSSSRNFGSRSFNSRTASYPYSHSCSPTNSITSSCNSVSRNSSPNLMMKSRLQENAHNKNDLSVSSSSRSDSSGTLNSPDRAVPVKLPPPPPPLPPARFWEVPMAAPKSSGHPVLVAPSSLRPVGLKNLGPTLGNEELMKNENVEKSEETPRPKLKPLHWDKVRASSDRAMVWDQFKSGSFQ